MPQPTFSKSSVSRHANSRPSRMCARCVFADSSARTEQLTLENTRGSSMPLRASSSSETSASGTARAFSAPILSPLVSVKNMSFVAFSPAATSAARRSEFILKILPSLFTATGESTGIMPSEIRLCSALKSIFSMRPALRWSTPEIIPTSVARTAFVETQRIFFVANASIIVWSAVAETSRASDSVASSTGFSP